MKYFVSLFLLVSFCPVLWASPVDKGVKAYHQGQYQLAFDTWHQLAKKGLPLAQLFLSHLYTKGLGVKPDKKQAHYWLQQAAQSGLAEAQYELALRYEIGEGTAEDYWQAEQWYQKAIDQGFCPGELGLEKYLITEHE